MKVAIVFLALVACVCAQTVYTSKYDNVDVDQVLNSKRLLDNYVKCLLGNGKCTPDGNELKQHLPDALATDCVKCSKKQKDGSEKVIKHLVNRRPEVWAQLSQKYDPTGVYTAKFRDEAQSKGIRV